jgi:hypothetical protein
MSILASREELAKLALTVTSKAEELLDPFDGLFLRVRLKDGEATDHFLGFGQRPIGHRQLAIGEANARAKGVGHAAFYGEEEGSFHPFLNPLSHFGNFLL